MNIVLRALECHKVVTRLDFTDMGTERAAALIFGNIEWCRVALPCKDEPNREVTDYLKDWERTNWKSLFR